MKPISKFILIFFVSFICFIVSGCPKQISFQFFQREIKQQVNPEDLQKWAVSILDSHKVDNEDHPIPLTDLPPYLKNIYGRQPRMAWISKGNATEKPAVAIWWGGGFMGWGLIIGEKDLEINNDDGKKVVRWIDGVYFSISNK